MIMRKTQLNRVFNCQKCGDCCKGYGGIFVNDREIKDISNYLKIEQEEFIDRYCELSGKRYMLKTCGSTGYCIFWEGLCSIHPVKPGLCKTWPFLECVLVDSTNFITIKSACPGVSREISIDEFIACVRAYHCSRNVQS
nr:YkgJ family cysteine cluster protein [Desulfobacterales bacterium]